MVYILVGFLLRKHNFLQHKFSSFYSFVLTDVSSARSLRCEIVRAALCSPSGDCLYTNQMTVNPDSNITLNCSIRNGGTTLGKTWKQVNEMLTPHANLILQQGNSTTRIYLARKYLLFYLLLKKIIIKMKEIRFSRSPYINYAFYHFHITCHKPIKTAIMNRV